MHLNFYLVCVICNNFKWKYVPFTVCLPWEMFLSSLPIFVFLFCCYKMFSACKNGNNIYIFFFFPIFENSFFQTSYYGINWKAYSSTSLVLRWASCMFQVMRFDLTCFSVWEIPVRRYGYYDVTLGMNVKNYWFLFYYYIFLNKGRI